MRCVVPKMLVVGWQVQGSRLSVQREREREREREMYPDSI
jgi:hypothetical protein